MIQTNEDLFEFLYQWHRARPGELCLPETAIPNGLPGVLQRAYAAIGLLTRRRSPFNPGNQNGCPLGTQDCLFEPEQLKIEDGLVRFVTENQGCWDCYVSVSEDDPEVFSTALHSLGRSETKLTPIGSKLSDFLITFCLQETVMSGLTKHAIMLSDDDERYQKISSEPIWLRGCPEFS